MEMGRELVELSRRDPMKLLGKTITIKVKGGVKGFGGGHIARHHPELLDHDCHHTPEGEDGCQCDVLWRK